jgi:hypothetical protein
MLEFSVPWDEINVLLSKGENMGALSEVPVLSDGASSGSKEKEGSSRHSRGALVCPTCEKPSLRRASRKGFLQCVVFPWFGYFPWRCKSCKAVQLMKNRGSRRRRNSSDH